jgi:ADP-ribosylglycohydrolase
MNPNDIKTLTDLHEELRAEGSHLLDFIVALCQTTDRHDAAERCQDFGGDEDAIADIIERIDARGL